MKMNTKIFEYLTNVIIKIYKYREYKFYYDTNSRFYIGDYGNDNEKEYEKVIQIVKEQGCEWNSGDSLDYIYCTFPTRLFFDKRNKNFFIWTQNG